MTDAAAAVPARPIASAALIQPLLASSHTTTPSSISLLASSIDVTTMPVVSAKRSRVSPARSWMPWPRSCAAVSCFCAACQSPNAAAAATAAAVMATADTPSGPNAMAAAAAELVSEASPDTTVKPLLATMMLTSAVSPVDSPPTASSIRFSCTAAPPMLPRNWKISDDTPETPLATSSSASNSGLKDSITPAVNLLSPRKAVPASSIARVRPSTVVRSILSNSSPKAPITESMPCLNAVKSAASSAAGRFLATASAVFCRSPMTLSM